MPEFDYLAPTLAQVHTGWKPVLEPLAPELFALEQKLLQRSAQGETIYPAPESVLRALSFAAPSAIRVVILGQDPYHGAGQAMGLSFSVMPDCRLPPSLRNIYKELASDLGVAPGNGDLSRWAQQGVLLLNSVLTVGADQAGSHGKLGWQVVTDALITSVAQENPGCVFMLWGAWAQSKAELIDAERHLILRSAHPSPLSAHRGFIGCRHFSQANLWLAEHGQSVINWK
ncbi:uracil-DNA glycosylase [Paludibacterium yongneupense]|uniref:uracil-DNA glycosylase n=1 Tax=Paludibacterium yongneupense TaxID=400061 RepID=UPI0004138DFF|nr:uracil-DNA glycosylase [Paludibacterium yongneupense]